MVDRRRSRGSDAAAEEAALVAKVASGDLGEPLEELFRRYAGRLYSLGLTLLGDAGLAEELVQESFVRLWREAPRFDPGRGTVGSFLFGVARRIAVDLWRRPSSRSIAFGLPGGRRPTAAVLADPAPGVVDGVMVRRALESLSPAHRQVIELAYDCGLTQAEIARQVGLPLGTVKTRMYHALRALKLVLKAEGVDA